MHMLKAYKIGELIEEDKRANRKKPKTAAQSNGNANGTKINASNFEEQESNKKKRSRRFLMCR